MSWLAKEWASSHRHQPNPHTVTSHRRAGVCRLCRWLPLPATRPTHLPSESLVFFVVTDPFTSPCEYTNSPVLSHTDRYTITAMRSEIALCSFFSQPPFTSLPRPGPFPHPKTDRQTTCPLAQARAPKVGGEGRRGGHLAGRPATELPYSHHPWDRAKRLAQRATGRSERLPPPQMPRPDTRPPQ